jgi:hypothetical protein
MMSEPNFAQPQFNVFQRANMWWETKEDSSTMTGVESLKRLYFEGVYLGKEDKRQLWKKEMQAINYWQHCLTLFVESIVSTNNFALGQTLYDFLTTTFKEDSNGFIELKKKYNGQVVDAKYRLIDLEKKGGKLSKENREKIAKELAEDGKTKEEIEVIFANEANLEADLISEEDEGTESKKRIEVVYNNKSKEYSYEDFDAELENENGEYAYKIDITKKDKIDEALKTFYETLYSLELYVCPKPLKSKDSDCKFYAKQVVTQLFDEPEGVYMDLATRKLFVVKDQRVYLTQSVQDDTFNVSAFTFLKNKSPLESLPLTLPNPGLNYVYDAMISMLDMFLSSQIQSTKEDWKKRHVEKRLEKNLDDEDNTYYRFGALASNDTDKLLSMSTDSADVWYKGSLLFEFSRFNKIPSKEEFQKPNGLTSNWQAFVGGVTDTSVKNGALQGDLKKYQGNINEVLKHLDECLYSDTEEVKRDVAKEKMKLAGYDEKSVNQKTFPKPHLMDYDKTLEETRVEDFFQKITKRKKKTKAYSFIRIFKWILHTF